MRISLFICLNICLLSLTALAQKPGVWKPLFSYRNTGKLLEAEGKLYCKADNALFSYDLESGEVATLSKTDRLSDVKIADIAYYPQSKSIVVLYQSGIVDVVSDTGTVKVSDLKYNKSITNKTLYCAAVFGSRAYIGADFGIAVLNLDTYEYEDSYFIGPQAAYLKVNKIAIDSTRNRIFAATPSGLMVADLGNKNLADFKSWTVFTSEDGSPLDMPIYHLASNGNYVYASGSRVDTLPQTTYMIDGLKAQLFAKQPKHITSMSVSNGLLHLSEWQKLYVYDASNYLRYSVDSSASNEASFTAAVTTQSNRVFVAQLGSGIAEIGKPAGIMPNGPFYDQISGIVFDRDNTMYASFGEEGTFRIGGYGIYKDHWLNRPEWGSYEMLCILLHPTQKDAFYVGSWGRGLFLYDNLYSVNTVYNSDNSPLENHYEKLCKIYDMKLDKYGNLWTANWASTTGLKILDTKGEWHVIKMPNRPKYDYITKMHITSYNQKLFINAFPVNSTYSICALDDKGTLSDASDDDYRVLGLKGGEDQAFAAYVFAIAEDKDGALWIGTDNGIATMSDPQSMFATADPQFRRIKVTNDSIVDYLLEGVDVRSIAVDAGNRKWFGTLNDGVFLMSDNGTEIIQHFTVDNSPLPSNYVSSIAIRPSDGEVFFCTDYGTVSYSSDAYKGVAEMDIIKVVPNPVREDYRGEIYISGLVDDALVKITDITGNLVYETYSNGGMATWPGYNLLGRRPQTGVYFIFVANADGTSTRVGKLMFIN